MDKTKLEDNSRASRDAKAKELERQNHYVEKVTTGTVKKQKKTLSKRVIDALFDQKVDEAIDYAKQNVIKPGIRRLIFDAFMGSLSMIFFGDARGYYSGDTGGRTGGGRRGYDRIFDSRNGRNDSYRRRSSTEISDIIFESYDDAKDTINTLYRELDRYGRVRVADYYSAAGVSGNSLWTDNNYGWYRLPDNLEPYPTVEGWQIDLPPCESLR